MCPHLDHHTVRFALNYKRQQDAVTPRAARVNSLEYGGYGACAVAHLLAVFQLKCCDNVVVPACRRQRSMATCSVSVANPVPKIMYTLVLCHVLPRWHSRPGEQRAGTRNTGRGHGRVSRSPQLALLGNGLDDERLHAVVRTSRVFARLGRGMPVVPFQAESVCATEGERSRERERKREEDLGFALALFWFGLVRSWTATLKAAFPLVRLTLVIAPFVLLQGAVFVGNFASVCGLPVQCVVSRNRQPQWYGCSFCRWFRK